MDKYSVIKNKVGRYYCEELGVFISDILLATFYYDPKDAVAVIDQQGFRDSNVVLVTICEVL